MKDELIFYPEKELWSRMNYRFETEGQLSLCLRQRDARILARSVDRNVRLNALASEHGFLKSCEYWGNAALDLLDSARLNIFSPHAAILREFWLVNRKVIASVTYMPSPNIRRCVTVQMIRKKNEERGLIY